MHKILFLLLLAFGFLSIGAQVRDYTRYVDPFIGTGGHGHTFPGATMPFGMVQLSPDTRTDNWDGSSGYHYSDDIIYGFSHTHLSGTGIPDYCDILFMPMLGGPKFFGKPGDQPANGYASKFSHANEIAEPGYYKVRLDDDGITAELTATKRVGLHRYTFPPSDFVNIILDLKWRDPVVDSELRIVDNHRIEGIRRSSSWAKDQIIYIVAEFSEPFLDGTTPSDYGRFSSEDAPLLNGGYFDGRPLVFHRIDGVGPRAAFRFKPSSGKAIMVKVALSPVSIESARKNLASELPGWDFDKVRADAKAAWNKELSKIDVAGGTDDQTKTFYTALYHTMIQPNIFNDVDGRYKGHDGKVHQLPGFAAVPLAEGRSSVSPSVLPLAERRRSASPSVVPLAERRSSVSPSTAGSPSGYAAVHQNRRRSRTNEISPARKSIAFPLGENQSTGRPLGENQSTGRPLGENQSTGLPLGENRSSGLPVGEGQATAFPLGEGTSHENPKSKTQNPKSEQYTVFSLWDTFRAAHPLYTIIEQKRTVDFINTFIRQYEQGGRLPVWELAGEETDTMIGYHAVSVIADAMAKGIKGFDYDKAYEAAKHSAELDHFGLSAYKKRGYISTEDENESVSKTLEYAYDDWCIMSMGATLYNIREFARPKDPKFDKAYFDKLSAEIDHYRRRAGNFENLFDTETGFFRPKQNGGFVKPFAPEEVTFHFTEGNAWQYSFFVPHDVTRLIQLMGGTEKFIAKLDELFTTQTKVSGREQPDITGLMGQYAHGNEPSHHIAYLYNYAGVPSKTQKRVRQIMDEFYKPTPDGLIGNEDCGQMSAWYVLSASGFYPVHPGDSRYDLGTPLFKQVTFNLESGKKFIIKAPNVSPVNIYIKSAKWNGGPQYTSYIAQDQIMAGGVLELNMSSTPNDRAFQAVSTSSVFQDFSAVPVIDGGGRVFNNSTTVALRSTSRNVTLHYTLDGTEPTAASPAYTTPFTIDKTTTVKAVVVRGGKVDSLAAEAVFHRRPNDWTVKIDSRYNRQYTGGGDEGLIDGIRGTLNFASGEWQGYQPQDFVATIDLQRETEIKNVGGGFLQNARSWIWMPTHIEFEVSEDGVNFKKVADIKTDVAPTDMTPVIRDYTADISPVRARYVRVHAYNLGKIPSWHPGAGDDAFIFVDEILVK